MAWKELWSDGNVAIGQSGSELCIVHKSCPTPPDTEDKSVFWIMAKCNSEGTIYECVGRCGYMHKITKKPYPYSRVSVNVAYEQIREFIQAWIPEPNDQIKVEVK